MKNKDRIEQLEKQVQNLVNRIHILEMRAFPLIPASAPTEWPTWKPFWAEGPSPRNPYTITCAGKQPAFAH